MADPFVSEIRIFGFNFAPRGWASCDGQVIPIAQNTALFALLGTYYGGNGKSTFALPDLQGSVPVHQGQGQGLSERFLGEQGGEEAVPLSAWEMPVHNHQLRVSADPATERQPAGQDFAAGVGVQFYDDTQGPDASLNPGALAVQGASLPHSNLQPYLVTNFCIAMQGIFPARG